MSMLFRPRTIVLPVWLLVFGVFLLLAWPLTVTTLAILLLVGGLVPAMVLGVWRAPSPTIAEVLHDVEMSRTEASQAE
jgi:hypothetical protein